MTLEEIIARCEVIERRYKEMAEDYLATGDYNNFNRYIALAEEEKLRLDYLKNYKVDK